MTTLWRSRQPCLQRCQTGTRRDVLTKADHRSFNCGDHIHKHMRIDIAHMAQAEQLPGIGSQTCCHLNTLLGKRLPERRIIGPLFIQYS